MPLDRPPTAPPMVENRTRIGTGRGILPGVDMRSGMGRRFREIVTQIEADLGSDVSEAKRALIVRSAVLIAWLEGQEARLARGETFDPGPYTTAVNTLKDVIDLHAYSATETTDAH